MRTRTLLLSAMSLALSSANAATPLDPAAKYAPALTSLQVQVGPTNPLPAQLSIPVNYSVYFAVHKESGKWKVGSVIGAVGADVWTKPIGGGWSLAQNGWTGGTVNGGAGVGTGFGVYYTPVKGLFASLKFGLSAGADAIAGQKGGMYAGATVTGTIKF